MSGKKRGLRIFVDGLDGIGKGEVERALIAYEQRLGKAVFDTISFSRANSKGLPEFKDFWNPPETQYHTIVTAEPTYAGIGHQIRNEVIKTNGRDYNARTQINSYSIDRLIQDKRFAVPAVEAGLNDIRSRCVAATFCYQVLKTVEEAKKENPRLAQKEKQRIIDKTRRQILATEGTKYQLENAPDLLIIPTIEDPKEVIERLKARAQNHKDDRAEFENLEFQTKLKEYFEDPWLKNLFEKHGTKVVYLDAGISPESTRQQAVDIYKELLEEKGIPYN